MNWSMNSRPGSTTDCDWMAPEATSTKSSRTSLGGWLGAGVGAPDAPAAGERVGFAVLGVGAADAPAAAPIGCTRIAVMVLPSGDHQKLATLPSRTVRTLPLAASSSRTGPSGIVNSGPPAAAAPMDPTVSPAGLNVIPAVPKTGILCALLPSRPETTTAAGPDAAAVT